MKKILFTLAITGCIALISHNATAQAEQTEITDSIMAENYYQVEIIHLPPHIQDTIYTVFESCLIKEVYISGGESSLTYKIHLITKELQNIVVFLNGTGNIIKTEPFIPEPVGQEKSESDPVSK